MAAAQDGAPRSGLAVGLDIGGTSIRAVVVDAQGTIIDSCRGATPTTVPAVEDAVADIVTALRRRHPVEAVGLAVAGFISADRSEVMFAPHVPWRGDRVPDRLAERLGLPVVMDHDVNAALVAEHAFGSARSAGIALLIAVGTGIGAALMIDGALYRGAFGVAPEWGHVVVVPDGRPCSCGKRGCWERYASGTGLAEAALEAWDSGRWGAPTALADLAGDDRSNLTGRAVVEAARRGDRVAIAAVEQVGWWIGAGVAMACDVLDPDVVVLGGGVSSAADLWWSSAERGLAERLTGGSHRPHAVLVSAEFGDLAGAVGGGLEALRSVTSR